MVCTQQEFSGPFGLGEYLNLVAYLGIRVDIPGVFQCDAGRPFVDGQALNDVLKRFSPLLQAGGILRSPSSPFSGSWGAITGANIPAKTTSPNSITGITGQLLSFR